MVIERDFTSRKITLVFETGERIELTKIETCEFDVRMKGIKEGN